MKNYKILLTFGIGISLFLIVSYFIPLTYTEQTNENIQEQITTSLLALIIFYNPWILVIYIGVAIFLIVFGLIKKRKNKF